MGATATAVASSPAALATLLAPDAGVPTLLPSMSFKQASVGRSVGGVCGACVELHFWCLAWKHEGKHARGA